jgi:hypothetical protein
MNKHIAYVACILLLPAAFVMSDSRAEDEAKAVAGMSIVGNSDAPKSLYIVPWKNQAANNDDGNESGKDAGKANKFTSNLLHDGLSPVDSAVFMRELDLYKLSNTN